MPARMYHTHRVAAILLVTCFATHAARLTSATTRDYDGDGILDAIEVRLDGDAVLRAGSSLDSIVVQQEKVRLTVTGISPGSDTASDSFTLQVSSLMTPEAGVHQNMYTDYRGKQTGWTPRLTMRSLEGCESIEGAVCTDGAGPVVWRVYQAWLGCVDDSTRKSLLRIDYSEPVVLLDGNGIDYVAVPPDSIFTGLRLDTIDTIAVPFPFAGMPFMHTVTSDTGIVGLCPWTSRGVGLSFRTASGITLADSQGNAAQRGFSGRDGGHEYSGPADVTIRLGEEFTPTDSPYTADISGPFRCYSRPTADRMTFGLLFETDNVDTRVSGGMTILDPNGNMVLRRTGDDLLSGDKVCNACAPGCATGDSLGGIPRQYWLFFYWCGWDQNGEPALAGGPYHATVYAEYNGKTFSASYDVYVKYSEALENGMPGTPGIHPWGFFGVGCGTGAGLAFLPPLGLLGARLWRKKRRAPAEDPGMPA